MKYVIGFLCIVTVACKTVTYPHVPISKKCKKNIYSLAKDTLDKEWLSETKSSNWKVVDITKSLSSGYAMKTKLKRDKYKGFFIVVYFDTTLKIKMVGKELTRN